MEEFNEMLRGALAERVQGIRKGFREGQDKESRNAHVKRMEAIIKSLSEEDGEWMYEHLTDGMLLSEEECTALYLAGVKDALRLLNRL